MKANTLDNVHTQLHPPFQMAVGDGLLRSNPTDEGLLRLKRKREKQLSFQSFLHTTLDILFALGFVKMKPT